MTDAAADSPTTTISRRALVIIAHGSRRTEANEEFFALVKHVSEGSTGYAAIVPALLEQAPPTLLQACLSLPEGIEQIDVYPLFLNQGRHVEKDIPAQVADVMEAMPEKTVRLLNYFGQSAGFPALIVQHLLSQS